MGAPWTPLLEADAPGPDELAKATTVNACRKPPTSGVAVTVTLVSVAGANAAHTSEVPKRALVRRTSDQVSPAPETVADCEVTLAGPSMRTKAKTQRPAPVVLKAAVVRAPEPARFTVTSTVGAAELAAFTWWATAADVLVVKLVSPE